MKKLLLFACMILTLSTAIAQSNVKAFTSTTNSNGRDTVTNAATKIQSLTLDGYWAVATIDVDITKISGTVGGTLTLEGSNTSTGFAVIGSSQTATDATKTYYFSVNPSIFRYYQVRYVGVTGPMAASFVTTALVRNPPK